MRDYVDTDFILRGPLSLSYIQCNSMCFLESCLNSCFDALHSNNGISIFVVSVRKSFIICLFPKTDSLCHTIKIQNVL